MSYTARLLAAASTLRLRRATSEFVALHLCTAARPADSLAFKGFSGLQPVFTY